VDRINWGFEQSVTFDDMSFADSAAEATVVGLAQENENFGISGGWNVAPAAGMNVLVSTTERFITDQLGRRFNATVTSITQSIATATAGGSTTVTSPGNERWISLFALAGRQFNDPIVDGNGNNKRKTMLRVVNALGDAEHPLGDYEPIAAKEAGVNKLCVVVGVESAVGSAVRPGLMADGVLVCDLRLEYLMTTPTNDNIFTDRRQRIMPPTVRAQNAARDVFGARNGVTREPTASPHTSLLGLYVFGGAAYINNISLSTDRAYTRVPNELASSPVRLKLSHASLARRDIITIDVTGEIRAVSGPNQTSPTAAVLAPTIPTDSVALFDVLVPAGASLGTQLVIVRRGFGLLPYPFSTMTGIIEGCRLGWDWGVGSATSTLVVTSRKNKVAFNGEVVEFDGAHTGSQYRLTSLPDQNANPFTGGGSLVPYYVYICRNQFWLSGSEKGCVFLVESTTPPDHSTGHAAANLVSVNGTISAADTLLVGAGFAFGSNRRPCLLSDDGWLRPLVGIGFTYASGGGTIQIPSPTSIMVDRVKASIYSESSSIPIYLAFRYANQPVAESMLDLFRPPASSVGLRQDHGEYDLPAAGGLIHTTSNAPTSFIVTPTAFHLVLPRINFGGAP
jgi:hypothetical protein